MMSAAVIPAVASRATASLLEGPLVRATTLGTTSAGAWLRVGQTSITIGDRTAVRLPNAVLADHARWGGVDSPIMIGARRVMMGDDVWEVVRWWNPRINSPPWETGTLADRASQLAEQAGHAEPCALRAALRSADGPATVDAARQLIGSGPGLTPAGDDHVAGALVGLRAFVAAHEPSVVAWIDRVWTQLAPFVRCSTTLLSFTLLRHAARGETVPEVTALGAALAGHGCVDGTLASLSAIGSTSGLEMARGLYDGAVAASAWVGS